MNQLENCQARYRSNTWMGRTSTDGPDEFEPTKFDCSFLPVLPPHQMEDEQIIVNGLMDKSQMWPLIKKVGQMYLTFLC